MNTRVNWWTWMFVIAFTIFMFLIPWKPAGATEVSAQCLDQQGNVRYIMVWETPRPWFVNGREVPFGQTTVTFKETVGSNPQNIFIPAYHGRIEKTKSLTIDWSRCVPRPTTTTSTTVPDTTTTVPDTTTTVPETTTTVPGTTTTAPRPTSTTVPVATTVATTSVPETTVAPRATTTTGLNWWVPGAPTTTPPTVPQDDTPAQSERSELPNTGATTQVLAFVALIMIVVGAILLLFWVRNHK